jgi:glucose-6-phosphate isomerase
VSGGERRRHRSRNVVSIGIDGSDLGPVMAYEALRFYSRRDMPFRFVSNVDSTDLVEATRDLESKTEPKLSHDSSTRSSRRLRQDHR